MSEVGDECERRPQGVDGGGGRGVGCVGVVDGGSNLVSRAENRLLSLDIGSCPARTVLQVSSANHT